MLMLFAVSAAPALAWTNPEVTPLCAPSAQQFAFNVKLSGTEPNYNFDWSFDKETWTTVAGSKGSNALTTPRGGTTLYVRWSSDHDSRGKAQGNTELCVKPTPSPSVTPAPTPTPTVTPTPIPTATPSETPVESSQPSQPPKSQQTLPPTDTASNAESGRVLDGIVYGFLAAALAVALVYYFSRWYERRK